MRNRNKRFRICSIVLVLLLINSIILSSCTQFTSTSAKTENPEYPKAEVVFQVSLPSPLITGDALVLEILDDVTGLYFNSNKYELAQKDVNNYFIRVPLTIGADIKYRYLRRGGHSDIEYTPQGSPVRFRVLNVTGPMLMQDVLSGWINQPYSGAVGRIRGQLIDQSNNTPIPNQLITAAGIQTISSSDGSFILENLPIGTHNLVILSMDGSYEPFQQGAVVAEESTTPVSILLKKRTLTEVTFVVNTPKGSTLDIPLRFVCNLSSLGNSYADLSAGSSSISSNLTILEKIAGDKYSIKLNLPTGTYIKYKYSLGDGFWNSELDKSGNFEVRELIVPSTNSTIQNQIETFKTPNFGEIQFDVKTPSDTPANEFVSIQFNPFGWMEPIQMVKASDNNWKYTLYSPLNLVGNVEYRFCRNDQCETANNVSSGSSAFTLQATQQIITVEIKEWLNLQQTTEPTKVDTNGGALQPRTDFIAGVELVANFPPSWKSSIDSGLQAVAGIGSNWVIYSPTWTATRINPPLFEQIPGNDLLWPELQSEVSHVSLAGLETVLFPRIVFTDSSSQYWNAAKKDSGWWQTLFERYQRFLIHNADLAQMMNVKGFMIGDPAMWPAMSEGALADGQISSSPENSDVQWSQLILDIRARYKGPIIGVISLSSTSNSFPTWLNYVDAIYVLFSPSLTEANGDSVESINGIFSQKLDEIVFPLYDQFKKPIIVGINYPSNNSSLNGCVALVDLCTDVNPTDLDASQIDLELQSRIYNAAVIASASRSWISGFISRGYSPFAIVQNKGSSIYAKPASDVLWFWFHYILNKAP